MNYYLYSNKKCADIVISFEKETIDDEILAELNNLIENAPINSRVGFDLKNIKNVNNSFFSIIKSFSLKKDVSLFNMSSDINFLLNIMNFNQYANLYVDENDFSENKRLLVKRNFKFCSN